MDSLSLGGDIQRKTFLSHVFSTTEEGKAEIFNSVQYAVLAIIPIVIMNKLIQRFAPEADMDKSSIEILIELFIQVVVIFVGLVLIHRTITYFPTYSGFKYENVTLTGAVLTFLVIILSIQSKLGMKANILVERLSDLWNGTSSSSEEEEKGARGIKKNGVRVRQPVSRHTPSQADYVDNNQIQNDLFPPAPTPSGAGVAQPVEYSAGPQPANSFLGGSFGSIF